MLMAKQITPTPMRELVLEFLLKQTAAISLNDLEDEFQHSDKVTLFRTLKTFEEKGVIHDIKNENESTKYALCQEECGNGTHYDIHIHFYCIDCKELICLPKEDLPQVKLPFDYELKEISFVARGICNKCKKNATLLQAEAK